MGQNPPHSLLQDNTCQILQLQTNFEYMYERCEEYNSSKSMIPHRV